MCQPPPIIGVWSVVCVLDQIRDDGIPVNKQMGEPPPIPDSPYQGAVVGAVNNASHLPDRIQGSGSNLFAVLKGPDGLLVG